MVRTINDLPELALIQVFQHLRPFDQQNIRLVCKKWNVLIIEEIPRTELVLLVRIPEMPLFWTHNHRPVNLDNSIAIKLNKIQKSTSFKRLFKSVKRLFIALYELNSIPLNELVRLFPSLKHLEVCNLHHGISTARQPTEIDFDLPHLQTLHLDCKIDLVSLACPSLTAMSMIGDFQMQEKFSGFANSLRFLKVRSFSHQLDWVLPNLEVVYFSENLEIDIESFENLKEIHYFYYPNFEEPLMCPHEFDSKVNETLALLFEKKTGLGRKLDLYHDGSKCKSPEEIRGIAKYYVFRNRISREEFELLLRDSDELKLKNVQKAFYCNDAVFDEYKDRLIDESVEQMARSISHLAIINDPPIEFVPHFIYKTICEPLDLKFKCLLKHVKWAHFGPLPQSVLDQLPDLMPSLLCLQSIFGYRSEFEVLNFSFLSRLRGLKELGIDNACLTIDLLTKLVDRCQFLDKVVITAQGFRLEITVERLNETRFAITFRISPNDPVTKNVSSWSEALDYLARNGELASHFFGEFFNQNYYLPNEDLDPLDYFYAQSH